MSTVFAVQAIFGAAVKFGAVKGLVKTYNELIIQNEIMVATCFCLCWNGKQN